jgi:hypothetical protein
VGDPIATAGAALDVINKGVQTIKLVMRPKAEVTVVEGGFARALPDGISDSNLDGGVDKVFPAVSSEYHGESQKSILGETLGGWLGAAWKWQLIFTCKSNVKDSGTGAYILDASMDVKTDLASDQIAWEWKVTFPGKGRWFNREQHIVELPFKLNVKCTNSLIYDTLWYESVYRGWIRGDGSFYCAGL